MLGHAFTDAGERLEFFGIAGDDFYGFGKAGDQFGGFLIAAITADDGAVDLQQLRGLAQNARNLSILHAGLHLLERIMRQVEGNCSHVEDH